MSKSGANRFSFFSKKEQVYPECDTCFEEQSLKQRKTGFCRSLSDSIGRLNRYWKKELGSEEFLENYVPIVIKRRPNSCGQDSSFEAKPCAEIAEISQLRPEDFMCIETCDKAFFDVKNDQHELLPEKHTVEESNENEEPSNTSLDELSRETEEPSCWTSCSEFEEPISPRDCLYLPSTDNTFRNLTKQPPLLEAAHSLARRVYMPEATIFLHSVLLYQQFCDFTQNENEQHLKYLKIVSQFIRMGSVDQINISNTCRQHILLSGDLFLLESSSPPNERRCIFDQAYHEVEATFMPIFCSREIKQFRFWIRGSYNSDT